MSGYNHAWEKFFNAVRSLVISTETLQERLVRPIIGISGLHADEIPPALKGKVKSLKSTMTAVAAKGDEGTIRATARTLSDEQAKNVALEIVSLYNSIATKSYENN